MEHAYIGFSKKAIDYRIKMRLSQTRRIFFGIAIVMLIVGIVGVYILTHTISDPIKKLSLFSHRVGEGKFEGKTTITSKDEIGDLAEDLNHMAGRLKELLIGVIIVRDSPAYEKKI